MDNDIMLNSAEVSENEYSEDEESMNESINIQRPQINASAAAANGNSSVPNVFGNMSGDDESQSMISSIPSSKGKKAKSEASSFTLSSVSVKDSKPRLSHADITNMKKEMLYQFDRLEKKGINLPRKFTMSSSLEEMQAEYERLKKDRTVDVSVRFQRKMLMTIITGIEFMNGKFDPFDVNLDGWSESVNDSITDYDEIFEELHEKYKGKANMAPELKLMFALGGSAFMFHLRNTMFKSALPGMADMMKQQQQQQAAYQNVGPGMAPPPPPQPMGGGLGGLMSGLMSGGIGNLLGGMMGGGAGAAPNPFMNPPTGGGGGNNAFKPPNVNDIMNDRVDAMSTISESEVSDVTTSTRITTKSKGNRRTLNL